MLKKNNSRWLFFLTLSALPFAFILFFIAPEPVGLGTHFGNDFPQHRIWWMQTKVFFASKGMIPLWNPLDDFGVIHFGWRGFSTFYPLNWWLYIPVYFGGSANYFSQYIQVSLHMTIAVFGIYFLLRKFAAVSTTAAIVSASLFLLNQRFVDSIRFPHTIETIAWVPWMVYFLLRTLDDFSPSSDITARRQKYVDWLMLCLCTLLCWLAGYGQYTYITFILCGVLIVFNARNIRGVIFGCSGLGVGSILASGVLLPIALQIRGSITRGGHNIEFAAADPIGSYVDMFTLPFALPVSSSAYFPVIFLVFSVAGVLFAFRTSSNIMVTFGMLIGMLLIGDLSLGTDGLLFRFFYENVPFYHAFRIQGRNNWITLVPVCFFCAIGTDGFLQGSRITKYLFLLITFLTCLGVVCLNRQGGIPNLEFSAYNMGWITKEKSFFSVVNLTLTMSAIFLLILFFNKNNWIKSIGLLVMCFIFVVSFGRYTTWLVDEMQEKAIMKASDFYPDGLLVPFKTGSSNRLISPAHIGDYAYVPKYEAYRSIVKKEYASTASRFAFSPLEKFGKKMNASVTISTFNPNKLVFTVHAPVKGRLLFFSSFSNLWNSSLEFRRGKGRFSDFTVFEVPGGSTEIEMTFRPLLIVIAGALTIIGLFGIIFCLFFLKSKVLPAKIVACFGLLTVFFYMYGIYSNGSFVTQQLYGKTTGDKRFGVVVVFMEY